MNTDQLDLNKLVDSCPDLDREQVILLIVWFLAKLETFPSIQLARMYGELSAEELTSVKLKEFASMLDGLDVVLSREPIYMNDGPFERVARMAEMEIHLE